jgi:HEAT repeat protein
MNPFHPRSFLLAVALGALSCATAADLSEFLGRIQSDQGATRAEAVSQAGPAGADAVVPLGELASANKGNASLAAQWALKNIAAYAGRPGGTPEEKKAVAEAFTRLLEAKYTKVTRTLALELLSITAGDAAVPKIAALLGDTDADVQDEARRSLQGIPGAASLQALVAALPKAEGRLKIGLINALGQRADPAAADALMSATATDDLEVKLAAIEAIARLGLPKDDRTKIPSWDSLTPPQVNRLAGAILRWADERNVKGAPEDAGEIYRQVFDNAKTEHLLCAALIGLEKTAPDQALDAAVQGLGHDENTVRVTAAQVLERLTANDSRTKALLDAYPAAKPEARALILRVLKTWNEKAFAH